MKRLLITFLIAFILLLLTGLFSSASAHRMVMAYQVGRIDIEVYFEDGTPARNAHVEVYKPDGSLYLEGETDDEGRFSFEKGVMQGDWKVVVEGTVPRAEMSIMAWAGTSTHRMLMDYRVGRVDLMAYYGGGAPAQNAHVEVYRPDGTLYLEGETDDEGKFSFEPEIMKGEWKAVTESMGHRAELSIEVWEQPVEAEQPSDQEEPAEPIGPTRTEQPTKMQGTTEMPLYTRVIAGFGYLIGLAGAAIGYMGWRVRRERGK